MALASGVLGSVLVAPGLLKRTRGYIMHMDVSPDEAGRSAVCSVGVLSAHVDVLIAFALAAFSPDVNATGVRFAECLSLRRGRVIEVGDTVLLRNKSRSLDPAYRGLVEVLKEVHLGGEGVARACRFCERSIEVPPSVKLAAPFVPRDI